LLELLYRERHHRLQEDAFADGVVSKQRDCANRQGDAARHDTNCRQKEA